MKSLQQITWWQWLICIIEVLAVMSIIFYIHLKMMDRWWKKELRKYNKDKEKDK